MSRSVMFGIILMILAESVAVHALVYARWPMASLALVACNVLTVWWISREGSAESRITLFADRLEVRHGRSTRADFPLAIVGDVRVPTWQEVPQAGTVGYRALSGGDDPNVLLTFEAPVSLRLAMGARRGVRVLGLRLESPEDFVSAVQRARG